MKTVLRQGACSQAPEVASIHKSKMFEVNKAILERCLPQDDDEATHGDSDAEDNDLTSSSAATQFSTASGRRPPSVQSLLTALISACDSSASSLQRCVPVMQPAATAVPQTTAEVEQLDMLPTPRLFHKEAATRSSPPSLFVSSFLVKDFSFFLKSDSGVNSSSLYPRVVLTWSMINSEI